MIVVPGPASRELGRKVAGLMKANVAPIFLKKFPDGEAYLRLDGEVKNQDVVIIQTTSPPQDTHLMQLFLMIDATKNLGAKRDDPSRGRIRGVFPQLIRDRRKFDDSEANLHFKV